MGIDPSEIPLHVDGPPAPHLEYEKQPETIMNSELDTIMEQEYRVPSQSFSGIFSKFFRWLFRRN